MTALGDFVTEFARELDARRRGPNPSDWKDFCGMIYAIDRSPDAAHIREKMERIVIDRDARFQDRARALLPILMTLLPPGSLQ
jgi:hypothetical protein